MKIKREKNNTYSIDISLGYDSLGKRIRKREKNIPTKKEAQKRLSELESRRDNKESFNTRRITIKDAYKLYYDECILEMQKGNLRESTLRSKSTIFKNHILPLIGTLKVKNLNEKNIMDFQSKLMNSNNKRKHNQPLAKETLIKIHKQLSAFINYCQKNHMIYYNPAKSVGNFKKEKKEQEYLNLDEFNLLKSKINNNMDMLIINLLFFGGIRIGELLGIKKESIHIDYEIPSNSYIDITSTYYNGKIRNTTKTKEAVRKIFLDNYTLSSYTTYDTEASSNEVYNESIYLFPSKKSHCGVVSDSTVRVMIRKYLKEANIDKNITPHKFRHSQVALLIAMGKPLEDIKQRLGHKDIRTTSNEYGHMYKSKKIELASDMTDYVKSHSKSTI